jgi:hypothetical protein
MSIGLYKYVDLKWDTDTNPQVALTVQVWSDTQMNTDDQGRK